MQARLENNMKSIGQEVVSKYENFKKFIKYSASFAIFGILRICNLSIGTLDLSAFLLLIYHLINKKNKKIQLSTYKICLGILSMELANLIMFKLPLPFVVPYQISSEDILSAILKITLCAAIYFFVILPVKHDPTVRVGVDGALEASRMYFFLMLFVFDYVIDFRRLMQITTKINFSKIQFETGNVILFALAFSFFLSFFVLIGQKLTSLIAIEIGHNGKTKTKKDD